MNPAAPDLSQLRRIPWSWKDLSLDMYSDFYGPACARGRNPVQAAFALLET